MMGTALGKFFLRDTVGKDSSIFPAWLANHSEGFGSSYQLMEKDV